MRRTVVVVREELRYGEGWTAASEGYDDDGIVCGCCGCGNRRRGCLDERVLHGMNADCVGEDGMQSPIIACVVAQPGNIAC